MRWAAAALGVALAVGTGGCGGGETGSRAAGDWARAVCPALSEWRAAVSDEPAYRPTSRDPQFEETARTGLLLRMAHSHTLTEHALAAIRSAGRPELAGGQQIRDRLEGGLIRLADWYVQVERALVDVRTADAEDYAVDLNQVAAIKPVDGVTPAGLIRWLRDEPRLAATFAEVADCHPLTKEVVADDSEQSPAVPPSSTG